jgi:FlaA1/EpsC-like NDP-sugar epimerase
MHSTSHWCPSGAKGLPSQCAAWSKLPTVRPSARRRDNVVAQTSKEMVGKRGNIVAQQTTDASKELVGKRVLIIGGSGRVGSSTASALLAKFPGIELTVGGRSEVSWRAALARRPDLAAATFQGLDITDDASIKVIVGLWWLLGPLVQWLLSLLLH